MPGGRNGPAGKVSTEPDTETFFQQMRQQFLFQTGSENISQSKLTA